MSNPKIIVRLFRAVQDLPMCMRYLEGHRAVLAQFGIQMITSNNHEWMTNPNMYVVVAESAENGDIIGGIRVQLVGGQQPLPLLEATGNMDPKIYDLIRRHEKNGITGEVCGLWNSRKYKGIGISKLLISVSSAILSQLNVKTLFGLCDKRNVEVMRANGGYTVETSVGNNGSFYYPKLDLLAYAIVLNDIKNLSLADEHVKKIIFELRKRPIQQRTLQGMKGDLDLDFRLLIQHENSTVIK